MRMQDIVCNATEETVNTRTTGCTEYGGLFEQPQQTQQTLATMGTTTSTISSSKAPMTIT